MDPRTQATAGGYYNPSTDSYERPQPIGSLADMPESASHIRDGVGLAEQRLSDIHDVIGLLEKRLETVLSPAPPSPVSTNTSKQAGPPMSHVSGRIQILNEGFAHASFRLRDLARRVEV